MADNDQHDHKHEKGDGHDHSHTPKVTLNDAEATLERLTTSSPEPGKI